MSLLYIAVDTVTSLARVSVDYVLSVWRWNTDLMDHIINLAFMPIYPDPIEMVDMSMATNHTSHSDEKRLIE